LYFSLSDAVSVNATMIRGQTGTIHRARRARY
jgi:hypothetical protein